jgi:hypothetical protein
LAHQLLLEFLVASTIFLQGKCLFNPLHDVAATRTRRESMKTMTLICAAALAMTAGGLGMHQAGWFATQRGGHVEARQGKPGDPLHSDAAMRYRANQSTSWRLVMTVR